MSDWVEATDPKTQRKYYYNKSTKKTQWTRPAEMDGGAATPVATSNGGGGGDEPENNPAFWAESKDPKTGRTYYYNKQTKKTQWTKPACLSADGAATPAATPASSTPPGAGSSAISAAPASTSLANAPLPSSSNLPASTSAAGSEWRETLDPKSGRKYWYNKVTKETTWKDPTGAAAAPTPASATATPSGSSLSIAASAGSSSSGAAGATPLRAQLDSDNEDDEADNILSSGIGGDGGGDAAAASGSGGANNAAHDDEDEDDHEDDSRPASGGGAGASAESAPEEKYDDSEEAQASRAKQMLSMLRDDSDDEGRGGRGGGDDDDNDKGDSDAMKQKQAQHARDVNDVKSKLKNDEEVDEAEAHDKLRFAKHRHGFFNRLLRRGETFGENKLLSFKKSLIKKALLKQNRDLDAEAVQAFKNIMSYMGDRKSSKQPLEHSKKLIRNLMMAPSGLRDEVYLQICKQTTQNPHMESLVKGWELMSFCLATFPPSKYLKNFLNDYLKKAAEDSSKQKVQSLAQICLERLPKIVQMGQRKQVPSTLELQCLMDAKPIPIRVNLVNGTFKTFTVDPYTTCKELEEMLIKKYNITLIEILALYEGAEDNVERILDPKDRVLDVMASWENKPLMEELKVDPKAKAKVDPKKQPQQLKVEKKEPKYNSFLYKAKLVLKTTNKELMSDPEAVNMVYIQATHDVVTTRYPCNEKDVTVLAALQLQATYGDYKKDVHVPGWLKTRIEEFMPASLLENRGKKSDSLVAEWEQKILAKYMKLNGFSSMDAKLNYLEYVQEWVFYGSSFFLIEQRQFKDYPSPLLMGINCEGVLLMHPEKKTVLENYQYTDIVTWGHSDEKFILVVGNIVQQRKLIFKTSDGKVMNHLIHDYVKFKVKSKEAQT